MGGAAPGSPDNPFWEFSLAVYGRAGVAAACLSLQDRRGLDVNLVLFCCWAGCGGRQLDDADLARLITAAGPWQTHVVAPLRAARRWLKTEAPESDLRQRLQTVELEAEAIEQRRLHDTLPLVAGPGAPGLAAGNMLAYLAVQDVAPEAADVVDLAAILRGCYPDLAPLQAVWAVTD